MTDSITSQVLELSFNARLHPRDSHGRWIRKAGTPPSEMPAWINSEIRRAEQHKVRRRANDTWTVTRGGHIVHGLHPSLEAKPPHLLGAWDFLRDGKVVKEPKTGDQARNSQNVWGTVINKGGGHAVIDANDRQRHLVDWRNGGVPVHTVPIPGGHWHPASAERNRLEAMGFEPDEVQRKLVSEAGQLNTLGQQLRNAGISAPQLGPQDRREARARELKRQGYGPESIRGIMDNETFGTNAEVRAPTPVAGGSWHFYSKNGMEVGAFAAVKGDRAVGPGGTVGRVGGHGDGRLAIDGVDDFRHYVHAGLGTELFARPKEDVDGWHPPTPDKPPVKWSFLTSHGGGQQLTGQQPKVGDLAKFQTVPGEIPVIGRVVGTMSRFAAIDGDDGHRHIVNWRQGKEVHKEPLSEVGPELPFGGNPVRVGPAPDQLSPGQWDTGPQPAFGVVPKPPPPKVRAPDDVPTISPGGSFDHTNPGAEHLRGITERDIESGSTSHPSQGVQGDTAIVKLKNGETIIHKEYTKYYSDMPDADELASYVGLALDAGSPPIARVPGGGPLEITMGYVDGETASRWGEHYGNDTYDLVHSDRGERIGLLDYLIGNPDRHDGNWMVNKQGEPVPIDNSSAFMIAEYTTSSPFWSAMGHKLSKADYEQLSQKLVALKPEFDRLGHKDWYRQMIKRAKLLDPANPQRVSDWANPMELGWRFDPLEPRDAHGRWTHGGSGYVVPDTERLSIPRPAHPTKPYYGHPRDHPFFAAHPVSAANIVSAFDQASPEETAQGMRWYADAHALAKAIGQGDVTKGAGLLASYSPQSPWPVNMFNAARAMELGRAIGPGEGMITGMMQHHAESAMNGASTEENFGRGAPKIHAFAKLIENGGDAPDDTEGQVVLDRHAMSVAMGVRLPKKVADGAPIDKERYYQHVADQYRIAAQQITARGTPVTPHQVQAITWLRQQRANAVEDKAGGVGHGGKGAGKGRQVMIERAWQNWRQLEQTEHYPVVSGTTEMAGGIAAQLLDLAGWEAS